MAYYSPRYREITGKEPPSAATPLADRRDVPVDNGLRLATLDRTARGGPRTELRCTLAEYQSHQFLSLRVWVQNSHGDFYPDPKRGCSIRLKECEAITEALRRGLRIAEGDAEALGLEAERAGL